MNKDFTPKRNKNSPNKLKPWICKKQSNATGHINKLNEHKFKSRYLMGYRKRTVRIVNEKGEMLGHITELAPAKLTRRFGHPFKSKNKDCRNKCGHRRNTWKSTKKQRRASRT